MGQAQRRKSQGNIAVYQLMRPSDTYDIVLISMIFAFVKILIKRNASNDPIRWNRLVQIQNLIEKVEQSYAGYIPEEYTNRAKKFLKYINTDLNSLLKDIKVIERS